MVQVWPSMPGKKGLVNGDRRERWPGAAHTLTGQVLSAVSQVKAWLGENVPKRGGKEKTNTLY